MDRHDNGSAPGATRRSALKSAAAAAAVLAGTATVPGIPFVHARQRTIRYLSNGVAAFPQIAEKAAEDLGITLEFHTRPNTELLKLAVSQPNDLDILEISYDSLPYLIALGKMQGIDTGRLSGAGRLLPLFTDGTVGGASVSWQGLAPNKTSFLETPDSTVPDKTPTGYRTLLPVTFNADSLGVRPDRTNRAVVSWRDLLSPDFEGCTAINGIPSIGIIDAAFALEAADLMRYADKGNMSRDEITRTVDHLIAFKRKGHFHGIWTHFSESVNFMASGPVCIQSMWQPAVTQVRQQGIDCLYPELAEGYRGWARGMTLPHTLSGYKRDLAYEIMNWYLDGYPGAVISRQGYYSTVPEQSRKYLSKDEWNYWYEGTEAESAIRSPVGIEIASRGARREGGAMIRRVQRIACWNSFMQERDHLRREWQRFLEA